jgi:hypothetical protein
MVLWHGNRKKNIEVNYMLDVTEKNRREKITVSVL